MISASLTGNIVLGLCSREILPASGEQIVMSPLPKGNNCILQQKQLIIVEFSIHLQDAIYCIVCIF